MIRMNLAAPPKARDRDEERYHFLRALDHMQCARLQLRKAEEEFAAIEGLDLAALRCQKHALQRAIRRARSTWARRNGQKPRRRSPRPR